jgi:hypothetical protein
MYINSNDRKIIESELNWRELEEIGIYKSELEENGDLEKLLNGEPVNVISLHLTLLGIDIVMDATLQIVMDDNVPMLEISGVKPDETEEEYLW